VFDRPLYIDESKVEDSVYKYSTPAEDLDISTGPLKSDGLKVDSAVYIFPTAES
jgi:hypothetical protein